MNNNFGLWKEKVKYMVGIGREIYLLLFFLVKMFKPLDILIICIKRDSFLRDERCNVYM